MYLRSGNYGILYEKNRNRIVIVLPQTELTALSSALPVEKRNSDLTVEKLSLILQTAMAVCRSEE